MSQEILARTNDQHTAPPKGSTSVDLYQCSCTLSFHAHVLLSLPVKRSSHTQSLHSVPCSFFLVFIFMSAVVGGTVALRAASQSCFLSLFHALLCFVTFCPTPCNTLPDISASARLSIIFVLGVQLKLLSIATYTKQILVKSPSLSD